jgi:hypothetical protein
LAGVDEAELFLAEFVLQPGGHGLGVAAHHGRMQLAAQRQQLTEQRRGGSVGDQPGEAGLQVGQLRGGPLGQQFGQG